MGSKEVDSNSKSGREKKTRIIFGGNIGGLVVVGALVVVGLFTTFVVMRYKNRDPNGKPSLRAKRSHERNKKNKDQGSRGLRCLLQPSSVSHGGHGGGTTLSDITNDKKRTNENCESVEAQEMDVPETQIFLLCDDHCVVRDDMYTTVDGRLIDNDEDKDVDHITESENKLSSDTLSPVELIEATMPELEICPLQSDVKEATITSGAAMVTHPSGCSVFNHITENIMTVNEQTEHSPLYIFSMLLIMMLLLSLVSVSGKVLLVALFSSLMFKALCKKFG